MVSAIYKQHLIFMMQLYEAKGLGKFYSEQAAGDREAVQLDAKYPSLGVVEASFDMGEDLIGNSHLNWKGTHDEVVLEMQGFRIFPPE